MRRPIPIDRDQLDAALQRIALLNRVVAEGTAEEARTAAAELCTLPSYQRLPTSPRSVALTA